MKKTITLLIIILILFGAGAYLVYDLSSDKGGTKYVTFAYNDGVNNDYKCKIKDYKINCIVTEPVNGKDEFVGWYDEENNAVDIEGDFNESVTLYPKFLTAQVATEEKKIERKHVITFNMNGGIGNIGKIEVKYEEQLYRLNSLPTKDGYIFLGFYDNKDYKKGKQYYDENGESVRNFDKASNTTLYAGWKKNSSFIEKPEVESKSYTVTFDANGGSGNMSEQVVTSNVQTTIKANTFTRNGYTFIGWKDKNGNNYIDGGSIKITSNITLYAEWKQNTVTPKTYIVTFDANGGSGSMTTQTVTSNVQTAIKTNSFTRTGYAFNGWNTKSDGSGKSYSNGENITLTSNITLYAQWKVNTYNIEYVLNGGTIGSSAPKIVKYNEMVTISVPTKKYIITIDNNGISSDLSNNSVIVNQTFAGWTYSNGNNLTAKYRKTGTSTDIAWSDGNVKVVADKFKNLRSENGTVKLIANFNNKEIQLPKVTKSGYVCGYSTTSTSTTITYLSEGKYVPVGNTKLYVICSKNVPQTNTISFNANGGSGKMSSQTVVYNTLTPLIANTFTKSGYIFNGWNTKSDGSGSNYSNRGNIKITSNIILYAQWSPCGAGTYSNGSVCSACAKGYYSTGSSNASCVACPKGYTTNGTGSKTKTSCYITCSENTRVTTIDGQCSGKCNTGSIISSHTVYSGKTSPACSTKSYTITFNANGGSGNMLAQTVVYNTPTPLKTNTFTRTGYTFTGWNTASDGNGKSYNNGENITLISNIILYAQWKVKTYTVSFNLNGGNGDKPENQTVSFGKKMSIISTSKPTKNGYKFMGYYDNTNYLNGKKYYNTDGSSARPYDKTSSVTLYAGWAKNETQINKYTISFNANGGSGGQSGSLEVTYGGSLPSISKIAPTKTGYIFMGWYDSNNYTNGIKYYDANGNAARQKYDVVKSNVTLFAGWQKKSVPTYTITFNANGGSGNMSAQTITSNVQTIIKTNTFTRSGYKFIGWKDDNNNSYSDKSYITITRNITLYAQWEQIGNLKIYFLSLGRFDGFLIMGNGTTIFIDGGFTSQGEKCAKFMKELGITRIDAIIGSHLHDNHINAHTVLLDNFEVGAAYYNDDPLTCKSRRTCSDNDTVKKEKLKKLTNMLKEKNIPINILTPGFNIKIGNLTFDVLAPLELGYGINRNSLHLILKYGNKKIYFTGDSDDKVFKAVYDKYNHSVFENIDIFKHPHHGGNEVPKYFIDVMKPKYVVVPNTEKGLADKEYKDVNSIVYELGKKLMDDKTIITGAGKDLKGYLLAETDGVTLTITDKRK